MNNQTEFSKRTTSGFPNEEDHSDEVTTFFYEYFDFPEEMPKIEPTESTLEKNFAGKDEWNDIFSLRLQFLNGSIFYFQIFLTPWGYQPFPCQDPMEAGLSKEEKPLSKILELYTLLS